MALWRRCIPYGIYPCCTAHSWMLCWNGFGSRIANFKLSDKKYGNVLFCKIVWLSQLLWTFTADWNLITSSLKVSMEESNGCSLTHLWNASLGTPREALEKVWARFKIIGRSEIEKDSWFNCMAASWSYTWEGEEGQAEIRAMNVIAIDRNIIV